MRVDRMSQREYDEWDEHLGFPRDGVSDEDIEADEYLGRIWLREYHNRLEARLQSEFGLRIENFKTDSTASVYLEAVTGYSALDDRMKSPYTLPRTEIDRLWGPTQKGSP